MGATAARLFDAMAEEYDVLEPWYEHLYARLHGIVQQTLAPTAHERGRRALDAGCGTGFQTALLESLGYRTHGVDIAPRPLALARGRVPAAALALASVQALPYRDAGFTAATCCGSTLSFVDEPAAALRELGRVLEPGGRLLVEVEHRWSLDLLWMLASAVAGDGLGYGVSRREAWRAIARGPRRSATIPYPGYGSLRLFTRHELRVMLAGAGLRPLRWWGIHWVTNLIPSTILHRQRLGPMTAALYRRLRALDARLGAWPLAAGAANSLVVLAERRAAGDATVAAPWPPT
jgi:MPBQ/MSBQ methyltransferase